MTETLTRIVAAAAITLAAAACNRDKEIVADMPRPEIILTDCDDSGTYYVHPGESLTISPEYRNATGARYAWTLDGATVGSEPSWTHTWTETGLYTVGLTVATDGGTAREQMYVSVQELTPPVISLPAPEGGWRVEAGGELVLRPQFRYDRLEPFSVRWLVDGREEATGREFAFSRDKTGDYRITIEARNADGCTSRELTVSVVESMLSVSFPPELLLNPAAELNVAAGMPLSLVPMVRGFEQPSFAWTVDGEPSGVDLPVLVCTPTQGVGSTLRVELTVAETAGRNKGRTASASTSVRVCAAPAMRPATAASDAHLSAVAEYLPAPGQFVDENGDLGHADHATACRHALEAMRAGATVSLGAYGGYIVACFDHSIAATGGKYDLAIGGNSFVVATGSSNEPGTVWVAQDVNGNGVPDDQWYALRGADTDAEPWTQLLDVAYSRPDAERMDVAWTASDGRNGVVEYLPEFHDQASYYPAWAPAAYTLRGLQLPARNRPDGSTWTLSPSPWGYADNYGSDAIELDLGDSRRGIYTGISLANAMAADGSPVALPFVDFVMVRSATVGTSGWLGEISTEVSDFVDFTMISR